MIKPLNTKVLLAENKTEAKTASGIIIEGGAGIVDTKTGTVIAIGPDVTTVKPGDVIYLDWAKCQVVKAGDKYRAIVDVEHITAIVEGAED